MAEIPQDRLCLNCQKAPIIGKPYSVYVCRECYLHAPVKCIVDWCAKPAGHKGGHSVARLKAEQFDGSQRD